MAQATEIAFIPLIPNSDVDDESSDASEVIKSSITTVSGQEGFQAAYYGRYVERADMLQLVVDWASLEAHETFMKSGTYQPFLKHLKSIASGDPELYHVRFETPFARPSSAPVTELVTLYFEPSYDPADFKENWQKFSETAAKNAEGIRSMAAGWSIEERYHKSLGEGVKGKVFVGAIGWTSVEAHMDYRETEAFKDSVKYLRDGPKGIEMHHVEFKGYRDYS
ncbi:hypothetical protein H2201_007216 [Coniosporium apollinis]|uniref:ABM domain-containing protein n=2 Tax=Coniosporium TaxID=2810619 RepID=A0ABQ9NPX5_9PEZI|nr:hypothetical protein H2199_002034 [Cladosporium sp. JES 115]KAJ9659780.1 hypothetical protein H2201_007216 [Coniosporium apollinis]